jgi:hypothetical protein
MQKKNPNQWHKWLPFCRMAIRDIIHSTTGYTPFELLFGRPMNKFLNYATDENEVKQTEISNRLEEIKNMFEETIPQAITNIEKAQETHNITQEKRATIQTQPLKQNGEVYIYIEVKKVHPKMDTDYEGPFFIDGITRRQNYWLRDSSNIRMKGALPLSRLKVKDKITQNKLQSTNPIDGEYLDIDSILENRQRNKKREFFVKWKDLPESENSWVEEENFADPIIIKNNF